MKIRGTRWRLVPHEFARTRCRNDENMWDKMASCPTFSGRKEIDESQLLVWQTRRAGGGRPRPENSQQARRDREDHFDGDLRLRPASLQRIHPDDGEGRCPWARVYGGSRRSRE